MICEKDFEAGARNMSTRSIFSIEEVYQSIKEEKNLTESHLGVPGNSKGCGGIIDIALNDSGISGAICSTTRVCASCDNSQLAAGWQSICTGIR